MQALLHPCVNCHLMYDSHAHHTLDRGTDPLPHGVQRCQHREVVRSDSQGFMLACRTCWCWWCCCCMHHSCTCHMFPQWICGLASSTLHRGRRWSFIGLRKMHERPKRGFWMPLRAAAPPILSLVARSCTNGSPVTGLSVTRSLYR
jgi:hypothetical protein